MKMTPLAAAALGLGLLALPARTEPADSLGRITRLTCKSSFKPDDGMREFRLRLRTARVDRGPDGRTRSLLVETLGDHEQPLQAFVLDRALIGGDGDLELSGPRLKLHVCLGPESAAGWDERGYQDSFLEIDGREQGFEKYGCLVDGLR